MVKTLNKSDEDRLVKALSNVADLTNENDDADPNEAIAKVASDMRLPHGHVQLLVNAYNTGRTTAQRRASDNLWDKVAEFKLADTGKILETMYPEPESVKTATQVYNESAVAEEYKHAPGWVDRLAKAQFKKEASKIDFKMVDKPAPYPREDNSFVKIKSAVKKEEDKVAEARRRASYAFDTCLELKEEIKDYFKSADAEPIGSVFRNALALHGDSVKGLFSQIVAEDPHLAKKASAFTSGRKSLKGSELKDFASLMDKVAHREVEFDIRPAIGPVYGLIEQCLEARNAYAELTQDYETKKASLRSVQEEIARPLFTRQEVEYPRTPDELLGSSDKQAASRPANSGNKNKPKEEDDKGFFTGLIGKRDYSSFNEKGFLGSAQSRIDKQEERTKRWDETQSSLPNAGKYLSLTGMSPFWAKGLGTAIDRIPYSPTSPERIQAKKDALQEMYKKRYMGGGASYEDDELLRNMESMKQEAMLSELLSGDDVLSQRDPHDVMQAYSSLRQIAPRAASNRETLRALLRDRLERGGATSISELDALTKIEKNLLAIENGRYRDED